MNRRDFLVRSALAAAAVPILAAAEDRKKGEAAPATSARHFEPLDDGRVHCTLCPKGCIVADGERGYCRVRENRKGQYFSLSYGRPCVLNPGDPIEKKPFFHVRPGTRAFSIATAGCNFACRFCQNWDISQARPEDVPAAAHPPEEIARLAEASGSKTIAYTYSEPVVFHEYVVDCAKAGRERGLKSVVVSNGFINEKPQRELFDVVDAIKIDFKGFSESFYKDVCDGELGAVKESLRRVAKSGVWLEVVVLLIPTLNDADDDLHRMSAWVVKELGPEVPLHFSRYQPQYKMKNIPPTPIDTVRRARDIAVREGAHFVYLGNVPGDDGQQTACPGCHGVVVRRRGYLLLENRLRDGKCPDCGRAIPGRWS